MDVVLRSVKQNTNHKYLLNFNTRQAYIESHEQIN